MSFEQFLDNYFSIIKTKIHLNSEIVKYYGKTLAPDFNSFNFWSIYIDENKVSEIIAFFLDPNKSHNQGSSFLSIFLKYINKHGLLKSIGAVRVECEFQTDKNRRIDIVIFFGNNDFVIGIENKIYEETQDQKEQISHYSEYLKNITNDNYLLIYLAPQNKQVSEYSISKGLKNQLIGEGKLIQLDYENDIINCIHEFSTISESDRVRSFLLDFEKTLHKMYIGGDIMNENDMILKYANENNENLELTLKIGNAVVELKNNLYQKFHEQLSEIGAELKIEYLKEKYCYSFKPQNWENYWISFSFEKNGLLNGIMRHKQDKNKTRNETIETQLTGKWNVSEWWLCWRFLYHNFDSNPDNFININNGKMKGEIKGIVENTIYKLQGYKM